MTVAIQSAKLGDELQEQEVNGTVECFQFCASALLRTQNERILGRIPILSKDEDGLAASFNKDVIFPNFLQDSEVVVPEYKIMIVR